MPDITRRFPDHISFHAVGGPGFVTGVVRNSARHELRDQPAVGLGSWTISYNNKLENAYETLRDFVWVARGRLNTFPFKDWLDYKVKATQGVCIATGVTHQYQLYRRYTVTSEDIGSPTGTFTYDRIIQLPRFGKITVNGATGLQVDYSTGLILSSTAPPSWFGEFDCLARLDIDHMDAEIVDKRGDGQFITTWASIPINEVLADD